jgi:hypothetical protein
MHSIIELADCRRHDSLVDAARVRLAREARPLAAPLRQRMANAVQTMLAIATHALNGVASHARGMHGEQRARPMLPATR